jgi:hypothetical protein
MIIILLIPTTSGALNQMLKGKVLLVVALHIILGVIAFFNFRLYHYIAEKPKGKITVHDDAREDLDGNIQTPQTEPAKKSQGSPSDVEINN